MRKANLCPYPLLLYHHVSFHLAPCGISGMAPLFSAGVHLFFIAGHPKEKNN